MTAPAHIRISRLSYPITALGPGRRVGLWVQGCRLACPGCMSRHTWDPDGGTEHTVIELTEQIGDALRRGADGITVSGGEPLQQPAIGVLLRSVAAVRDETHPSADILLYTGYSHGAATRLAPAAVAAADALVTGRYLIGRPTRLIWRGSANQRLIPRTALGVERYTRFLEYEPEQAPIQLGQDDTGLWLVGVPRSGDLDRLTAAVRARGLLTGGSSWTEGCRG